MGKMDGRVAIVTGGNSGIGEATAKLLAAEGAKVAILARREEEGARVVSDIEAAGGDATFFACDVTSRDSVRSAVQGAIAKYGFCCTLFNNAGGSYNDQFPADEDGRFEKTLSLNLVSAYRVTSEVWQSMIDAGGGTIVNMSSLSATASVSPEQRKLMPGLPSIGYAVSKAGMDGFTRYVASLGAEHKIRVNGVRPGQVITPMATQFTPGHHVFEGYFEHTQLTPGPGTPEDVANLVVFLLSDESRFINAQVVDIDGGTAGKV
jgi:NAD(P)-dependent dehydrogenase (short-subunit alcohol dehydrogenase family)